MNTNFVYFNKKTIFKMEIKNKKFKRENESLNS